MFRYAVVNLRKKLCVTTSRGREEANEEKLRRWKREQALFMQRSPELFLNGDPWLGPNLSAESEYFSL